jgi:peptidoglycan hydrolase-like protein with peptidoglycan-binding domain
MQRNQSVCADEKTKLDAIDASAAGARQQYVEFLAHAACLSQVKEAQTELARLGCYNASISGKFDEATKKSLALYNVKIGSLADGDHITGGLLSELKQQNLGLCPPESPNTRVSQVRTIKGRGSGKRRGKKSPSQSRQGTEFSAPHVKKSRHRGHIHVSCDQ